MAALLCQKVESGTRSSAGVKGRCPIIEGGIHQQDTGVFKLRIPKNRASGHIKENVQKDL